MIVLAPGRWSELTWLEAIDQALDANQALVAARKTLTAQHKDVAIARSKMLPVIAGGALAQVSKDTTDGESTLLNLLDAQQQLIGANTSARQALYQFLSDLLTLEQTIAYYPFLEDDADARVRELEGQLH